MRAVSCVFVAGVLAEASNSAGCDLEATFADMGDGDRKTVKIANSNAVITSASGESWEVDTTFDCDTNDMMVDFDVPGKPDFPPVPLHATKWITSSMQSSKTVFEFNDPSGTLSWIDYPLNQWVDISTAPQPAQDWARCPTSLHAVYADMGDGDRKEVTIDGTALTIKPSGNDQVWEVNTVLDENCQAIVDFKASGKPDYPPVDLTATFWQAKQGGDAKTIFEFTDPSGTLSWIDFPLNHWVELPGTRVGATAAQCPGSATSGIHAGMKITATAAAACDTVKGEMKARLAGTNGWYDKHNRGTYTEQNYGGDVSASRLTGDGKYTDKMIFTLTSSGDSCLIEACSESQVFSIGDGGTNYCELKLMYCGSDEGCLYAGSDFTNSGETTEKRASASTGMSNCLKAVESV